MPVLLGLLCPFLLQAQPELEQWGTLRGLRIDGHLHRLDAGLETLHADGDTASKTAHYANPSSYKRLGAVQAVTVTLGSYAVTERVSAPSAAEALVELEAEVKADATDGLAYFLELPLSDFADSTLEWIEPVAETRSRKASEVLAQTQDLRVQARGLRVRSAGRIVELRSQEPLQIELPKTRPLAEGQIPTLRTRFLLNQGPVKAGAKVSGRFTLRVEGAPDTSKATVDIDCANPGRAFLGVGGNFRLQFKETDPAIIDKNLDTLRLAYSRIAIWWRDWDVGEGQDSLASARSGKVTERQRAQMEMARRLHKQGLPLIVSAWDPPDWAIRPGPLAPGTYSPAINPAKFARAAESIADYLVYLKQQYGVEAQLFSFNEPDLGLNPTPEEHVLMTRIFGSTFAARGLATRLLLADTSNATQKSLRLAKAVGNDPEALSHVGALGFHTWGGCEDENLVAWSETARALKLPLLATECGSDAEAHKHPDLFLEPWFQLDQAALYVRLCALAQPATLMEWQLTADYSLFKGGGAYGHQGPLEPTMRYWNYRQLAQTPAGAFALPIRCDKPVVVSAAFADIARGRYAIHLVNTGATRQVEIKGLPRQAKCFKAYVTDASRGMQPLGEFTSSDGQLSLSLPAAGFTSLYAE